MPGGRLLRGAAAASMVSSARTNRAVRKSIENHDQAQAAPAQAQPVAASSPAQSDTASQLAELAQLRDQGILTEEEFAAKKKQILGI